MTAKTMERRNPLVGRDEPMALASDNGAEVALTYDYSQIADEHRATVRGAATDIKRRTVRAQADLILAGQRLTEVKDLLPHGQFEKWIGAEFNMSLRMAQNLMSVAEVYAGKSEIIAFLQPTVLYMLAAPSVPEAARVEVIEQAQATGKPPSVAEVKATIATHRPPKPSPPAPALRPLTVDETEAVIWRVMRRWGENEAGQRTWLAMHFQPSDYAEALADGVVIADDAFAVAYRRAQEAVGNRKVSEPAPLPTVTAATKPNQRKPSYGMDASELRHSLDALENAAGALATMAEHCERRPGERDELNLARQTILAIIGRWEE